MRRSLLNILFTAGLGLTFASPAFADDTGVLVGAGLGGLVGSTIGHGTGRLVATGAGVFVGGAIGNELTRPSYGAYYSRPTYNDSYPYDMFPPVGNYVSYQPNYVAPPDPQPVTYINNGNYCRQYSQTVRIGNRVQESYGTACLQPDGSWHIVQ